MSIYQRLERDGVTVVPQLIDAHETTFMYENILNNLTVCAKELSCTLDEYLSCVSRWVAPSPIILPFMNLIEKTLTPQITEILGHRVSLTKANIISKSIHAPQIVPCHQDIAYQQHSTYDFSVWVALNDIEQSDGPLECLPGSQKETIHPAIDFWQPGFEDKVRSSYAWQQHARAYPLRAGDAVLFDVRTWHGSAQNFGSKCRFALVSRWQFVDQNRQYSIPNKRPAKFGMWTCYDESFRLLSQLVRYYEMPPSQDFKTLLKQVEGIIPMLSAKINIHSAMKALFQVKILHLADELHQGGDAQGYVYANLWSNLLTYIDNEEVFQDDSRKTCPIS